MLTFVCIICQAEFPRGLGRPVSDDKYPSWRCTDSEACADRFLASAS